MNKLSDETMIEILMHLRAIELATLTETNKEIFSRYRIGMAIQRIIKESPTLINATSPFKKHILRLQHAKGLLRPLSLYVFEVANILSALTFPQPLFGKGYWISASWASNAKKYFEAVPMRDMVENALLTLQMPANTITSSINTPTLQKGHHNTQKQHHYNRSGESSPVVVVNLSLTNTPQKSTQPLSTSTPSSPSYILHPTTSLPNNTNSNSPAVSLSTSKQHQQPLQPQRYIGKSNKIRQRRGSDAVPPWPDINAELICMHNGLSSHKIPNAKRKAMAGVAWRMLRKYYPLGQSFHIAHVHECAQCLSQTDEAKQLAQGKKESTLQMRKKQWCPPALQALNQRAKQGVPSDRLISPYHMYLFEEIDEDGQVVYYETAALPSSALVQAVSLPPLPPIAAGTLQNVSGTTTTASGSRSDSPLSSTSTVQAITTSAANTSARAVNDQIDKNIDNSIVYNVRNANSGITNNIRDSAVENIRDTTITHWPIPLPEFTYPLLPGAYYLISRGWLKQWRRFIKDATVTQAPLITPAMDCTRLLCHRHGHLLVPHHLEEYLVGIKRSLLTGLGEYLGEVVEIVTAEEWEALSNICHKTNHSNSYSSNDMPLQSSPLSRARSSDFSVSFTIDVSKNELRPDEQQLQLYQLQWNIPVCHVCDPLNMVREENARTWR